MPAHAPAPGVVFTIQRKPAEPSPLRSDVAAFAGSTRRGPVGVPVRVEGWREYLERFGGLDAQHDTPYAVRAYFDNGGEVAWIVRVAGTPVSAAKPARADVSPGAVRIADDIDWFSTIEATSPGSWADRGRVTITYRRVGVADKAEVELVIDVDGEREFIRGLDPSESDRWPLRLIRFVRAEPERVFAAAATGAREVRTTITLEDGADPVPDRVGYLDALARLGEEAEIAILALPELQRDPALATFSAEVLEAAVQQAEELHDRIVLVDLMDADRDVTAAAKYAASFRSVMQTSARAAAIYHPPVTVTDPLAKWEPRVRTIAASGPVAGLISRMDRLRGAHFTPANASLEETLDVTHGFDERERGELNAVGVNVLRCVPGKGIQVWGGRTLGGEHKHLAHRRLVHRLVRAIRRVAAPLVFEVNGPELWMMLVRGITTLLLQAWRAGALKGTRPEDAFRVRCDDTTNPDRDNGLVVCEVHVAPATPMEFITLRIALGQEGTLEVFES